MDWDDVKAILSTIVVLGLIVASVVLLISCEEHAQENKFKEDISHYSIISVNGEEYKTEDIESVKVDCYTHRNDVYTIYLKDDTKITFMEGGYTLKEKK